MLDFLIPNYIAEGKTQLVIAIGCTGGKHRSVTLTNAMYEEYANTEYGCKKEHRDIEKDRLRYICRSQEKFEKLKTFYEKGLNQVGWNKYSRISLEFNNQIICTKKEK